MSRLILITGGARSGKSTYAEKRAKEVDSKTLYIATAIPFDNEMKDRIKKHKSVRPDNWDTFEGYKNLGKVIKEESKRYPCILLDCLTLLVTNLMFEYASDDAFDMMTQQEVGHIENLIMGDIRNLIEGIKSIDSTVILVTNELGLGLVPEHKLGRIFRDIQGRVNQRIGEAADEVYFTVCGIPMKVK